MKKDLPEPGVESLIDAAKRKGDGVVTVSADASLPTTGTWANPDAPPWPEMTMESLLEAVELLKKNAILPDADGCYTFILPPENALWYRINTEARTYEEWSRRIGQMFMLRRLSERRRIEIVWPEKVEDLGP